MLVRLMFPAPKARASRDIVSKGGALVFVLFSFASFIACGSHSPSSNPNSTTNSASLNILGALPSASVGSNYNATVAVTGGAAPYKFSVVSGALPTGVSLAADKGTISGTPTATGNFNFSISVSDFSGESAQKGLQIVVSTGSSPTAGGTGVSNQGNSFSNLQASGGWDGFGQVGPNYVDCSPSPCNGISFSMTQGVNSPSLSGQATIFNVGGSTPFSDALWTNHLIGTASSQGLPDTNSTLVPSLHNFTYDVYFYGENFALAQAVEFDVNLFFNNMGFIFGHECRIASGNEWDVWDNQNAHWVPTGVPCNPNNNSWNHLTIQVQRDSNDNLVYQSIAFNGVTSTLNWTFPHGSSSNWYGVTINYQMDGDSQQDSYNVYLDNLTFSYQ
jgi:hypothetical protein